MMKTVYRILLVSVIALSILSDSARVYSCGPFFPSAVFVDRDGPDFGFGTYLQGHLGIVQSSYAPLYLYAAYRYFNGRPLSDSEQAIVMSVSGPEASAWQTSPGYDAWLKARELVLGQNVAPQIPVNADVPADSGQSYLFYVNINDDAFFTAAQTLQQRIAQFGAKSPAVADWLQAQDAVFQSEEAMKLPMPPDNSLPPIFREDRAYQIASAYFYMRQFSVAESLFTFIGSDTASPWNKLSKYLVARAIIRSATLGASNQDSLLQIAGDYLQRLLKEPGMKELYPAAGRLLNFCMFRTEPQELFARLDPSIEAPTIGVAFSNIWNDFMDVMNVIRDSTFISKYDFPYWLNSYYGYGRTSFEQAYTRWLAVKSPAWLVAALSLASPSSKDLPALFRAADSISPHSPAFPTVTYLKIRLLVSAGRNKEATKLIGTMLANNYAPGSVSYRNLLLSERAKTVNNLVDFLRYCHMRPYGSYSDYDGYTEPSSDSVELFTSSASALNKYVPLHLLETACISSALPSDLRTSLVHATWVRSFLLDDRKVTMDLTPLFEEMTPEAKPYLEQYRSAAGGEARKFSGVYLLLKFPGLHPNIRIGERRDTPLDAMDDYRDNWWYPGDQAVEGSAAGAYSYGSDWADDETDTSTTAPAFLTKSDKELAKEETRKLSSLPAAPDYLIGIVVGWANGHPEDSRVPEALHIAVQTSRFGCHDSLTTNLAKEAFELLHSRYPGSTWTKETKYYY